MTLEFDLEYKNKIKKSFFVYVIVIVYAGILVKKQLKQMLYFKNSAGPARVLTLGISRISHETFRKNKKKKRKKKKH